MRKTSAGQIFIDFEKKIVVSDVAEKLKAALCNAIEATALVSKATVQVKNIDTITTKKELVEGMR
jgi:hypothetical protein